MVYRIYVEKKEGFRDEAKKLLSDVKEILGVEGVEDIRILNRYDAEDVEEDIFRKCAKTVFSQPQTDVVNEGAYGFEGARVFAVEHLPGRFDQKADSAAQCVQLVSMGSRPVVRTAKVYAVYGNVSEEGLAAIKQCVINPAESREASLAIPATLKTERPVPAEAETPRMDKTERTMKTDIEIAQEAKLEHISRIAAKANLSEDEIEYYGKYKAKIDLSVLSRNKADGKLVLVTAITPTPAGEGKTTTTIGLADGMRRIGKRAVVALREPSLGPVFGVKGGAAGGGYAQVVPMEDINLHFTGDFHAIGAANNLLAAMLDNHIFQGNELGIDPEKITWRRCVDMNDRQLRNVQDGLGGGKNGVPRKDGFDITVASEIMAVLCLATSLTDLKARLSRIVVGYTYEGRAVTAGDLKAAGAMCALLKDALKPNLVQTLEGTPALVHGGPFANIAHGCNSVVATKAALKLGDYVITEAGFGADLGAEKFLDIKCRFAGLKPAAVVIVATVRALKMHGGLAKNELSQENLPALEKGMPNLLKHVSNITNVYKLPAVVAVNRFPTDTDAEITLVIGKCRALGVNAVLSTVRAEGGKGGEELAKEVVRLTERGNGFTYCYDEKLPIKDKIHAVVTKIYGGGGVEYTEEAEAQIKRLEELGFGGTPVCMAKTQYSFSDDAAKLGAPEGFTVTVRSVKVSAGAGFVVVLTGNILTMPGLPKVPAANNIDVDENGKITGLF